MHLSGSVDFSPNKQNKILVGSVEEAIRLGADAVSMQVNIGIKDDEKMLSDLGAVSEQCDLWNIPLLVMIYPQFSDRMNVEERVNMTLHCIRICEELGADIVKVGYIPGLEKENSYFDNARIKIVIAGGEKIEEECFLNFVSEAIKHGVDGIAIGRNVFQSENPINMISKLCEIVHSNKTK